MKPINSIQATLATSVEKMIFSNEIKLIILHSKESTASTRLQKNIMLYAKFNILTIAFSLPVGYVL